MDKEMAKMQRQGTAVHIWGPLRKLTESGAVSEAGEAGLDRESRALPATLGRVTFTPKYLLCLPAVPILVSTVATTPLPSDRRLVSLLG